MDELLLKDLVKNLGAAFAAGFAVQRALEILDSLLGGMGWLGDYKKPVVSFVSLLMGMGIALGAHLTVIHAIAPNATLSNNLDIFITGLVISGGTEGFNSIMKFLSYKKEEKKVEAVKKTTEQPAGLRAAASRI